MSRSTASKHLPKPVIAAWDRESAAWIVRALATVDLNPSGCVYGSDRWLKRALALFETPGLLILVPSTRLGRDPFELVSTVVGMGGRALVWTPGHRRESVDYRDRWLLERGIVQHGGRNEPRLSVIARAAEIYPSLVNVPWPGISVVGRANAVKTHLVGALTRAGLAARRSPLSLAATEGGVALSIKKKTISEALFPEEIIDALALLRPESQGVDDTVVADRGAISLFLQPPPRLLSETGSKQIFQAYGLALPRERLCHSPSEASRFAKTLGGKAVFKLVKPKLEGKEALGAVITDVEGPSAGRQAAHTLMGISAALGPPQALGVLVAEQVAAKTHLWLKLEDHPVFGRLVLIGAGNTIGRAGAALCAPASTPAAHRAILDAHLAPDEGTALKLARGVARFSTLVTELAAYVNRAEIHPLVAAPHLPDAVVLDGLISIGV